MVTNFNIEFIKSEIFLEIGSFFDILEVKMFYGL